MKINEFRAWDKENKVMVYSDKSFPLSEYRFEIDVMYGNGLILTKLSSRTNITYEDGEEGFINDFEKVDADIMQYTGLKDKNGTKIYKGDIVKIQTVKVNEDDYVIGTVTYSEFEGMYITNKGYILGRVSHRAEVIGNVYENSELLEK